MGACMSTVHVRAPGTLLLCIGFNAWSNYTVELEKQAREHLGTRYWLTPVAGGLTESRRCAFRARFGWGLRAAACFFESLLSSSCFGRGRRLPLSERVSIPIALAVSFFLWGPLFGSVRCVQRLEQPDHSICGGRFIKHLFWALSVVVAHK